MEIFTLIFFASFGGVFLSGGSLNRPLRRETPTEIDSSRDMGEHGKWLLALFVMVVAESKFSVDSETCTSIGTGPTSSNPGISRGNGTGSIIGTSTLCGG